MFSRHFVISICSIPIVLIFQWIVWTIPYARTGFFCDDDEIRYPLKNDTVPSHLMSFIFSCLSLIIVFVGEFSLVRHLSKKGKRVYRETDKLAHPSIENFFYVLSMMICGDLATSIIVDVGKRTMSRLRPNFLAVCQPNLTALCNPNASHQFIADYECFGEFQKNEYYSFPSGHSAESVFLGIFLILYIQKRCKLMDPIRSLLQLCLAGFVFFICTSRVRDFKHRLSDVCGGVFVGTAIGLFFITHVANYFRHARYQTTDQEINHRHGYQTFDANDYESFLPKFVNSSSTSDYGSVVNE